MSSDFQVVGTNDSADFTLKIHRGEGMALLGMNWRTGKPPINFVGFVIEFREPEGTEFFALMNRLAFSGADGKLNPQALSTRASPIQKFRWVHFPRNANKEGKFTYRVTPAFMSPTDALSYGAPQEASLSLARETYPGKLNVTFTRGFVSSQAFVDRFVKTGAGIRELLPAQADAGLDFNPTHPDADEALPWMGFEATAAILDVLDEAIADTRSEVRVVAYDLSQAEVVRKLLKLKKRLQIIIDDSGSHGASGSAESKAAARIAAAGGTVKRQHLGSLQHNKTIVVNGPKVKAVVCGSTNISWRGFYVQANNAVVMRGSKAIAPFEAAFDNYLADTDNSAATFGKTSSAKWSNLGLTGINAKVSFSPHIASNALLQTIADDIGKHTTSSLFYSLAFLYQTRGPIRTAIVKVKNRSNRFVYGISDRKAKGDGLDVQKPNGNVVPVFAAALSKGLPRPFKAEPAGGGGVRMHHKFVVIDFDQPTARVYLGSYNFSNPADRRNGENLLLIKDRRIAVSYMIEALRIFDHYHFRVSQQESGRKELNLQRPPRKPGERPWWDEHYRDKVKIRDRELFS